MAKIRNQQNADLICEKLADGWTLRQVARELGCDKHAITKWADADPEGFGPRYARAMEARWDNMAEELQEISDEGSNDWMEREGITVPDHEHIQRSRLRVDTRKWLLAKMRPRQFGDKLMHTGADGSGPVMIVTGVSRAED